MDGTLTACNRDSCTACRVCTRARCVQEMVPLFNTTDGQATYICFRCVLTAPGKPARIRS